MLILGGGGGGCFAGANQVSDGAIAPSSPATASREEELDDIWLCSEQIR